MDRAKRSPFAASFLQTGCCHQGLAGQTKRLWGAGGEPCPRGQELAPRRKLSAKGRTHSGPRAPVMLAHLDSRAQRGVPRLEFRSVCPASGVCCLPSPELREQPVCSDGKAKTQAGAKA